MSYAALLPLLRARLDGRAAAWLEESLSVAQARGLGDGGFARSWSAAGRRLGREPVAVAAGEAARLEAEGAPFVPEGWGLDEAGRAALLLAAVRAVPAGELVERVEELFRTSELREQQALVRALAYLPAPERFAGLAAEAVRTNALSLIEAVACDNPFPAAHMPDPSFNQMVMKALFNGLALARIRGLGRRRNAELVRMVASWVGERRTAGRSVPADVDLILSGDSHAAS